MISESAIRRESPVRLGRFVVRTRVVFLLVVAVCIAALVRLPAAHSADGPESGARSRAISELPGQVLFEPASSEQVLRFVMTARPDVHDSIGEFAERFSSKPSSEDKMSMFRESKPVSLGNSRPEPAGTPGSC